MYYVEVNHAFYFLLPYHGHYFNSNLYKNYYFESCPVYVHLSLFRLLERSRLIMFSQSNCVCVCSEECAEYVEIGSLNGLFVLGRTMGFIGEC